MSKDEWISEHDRICEAFTCGEMNEPDFRRAMKSLGFSWDETDTCLAELKELSTPILP